MRSSHQFFEDAAVCAFVVTAATTGLEQQQLLLQRAHALEPSSHLVDLLLHQPVHVRVRLARCVQRAQQPADVGQRHLQRAAVADEGQPIQVSARVVAVTVVLPGWLRQQALFFVVGV